MSGFLFFSFSHVKLKGKQWGAKKINNLSSVVSKLSPCIWVHVSQPDRFRAAELLCIYLREKMRAEFLITYGEEFTEKPNCLYDFLIIGKISDQLSHPNFFKEGPCDGYLLGEAARWRPRRGRGRSRGHGGSHGLGRGRGRGSAPAAALRRSHHIRSQHIRSSVTCTSMMSAF